jgi:catechol 2,3-dioxygenase-like lactoylglutathione lyase family enzyme
MTWSPTCHPGQTDPVIDHISLQVADVARSQAFYQVVLSPLGLRAAFTDGEWVGFAAGQRAAFWIGPAADRSRPRELHLAFTATDRTAVRRFHAAALSVDADVLHAPRRFPEYHANYFGCFVRDPDGHNVEAVCHQPDAAPPGSAPGRNSGVSPR